MSASVLGIGYFAQEEQHMDDSQRVIDYVKDIAEYVTTKDGQISASQLLERLYGLHQWKLQIICR